MLPSRGKEPLRKTPTHPLWSCSQSSEIDFQDIHFIVIGLDFPPEMNCLPILNELSPHPSYTETGGQR